MWIGRYEVVGELGRGGMAVVYAARHPDDPRPLAIKLLKGVANARALARFAREAATMARVSHPHVIRIVDVGETPQGPYLVLEQIEGRSLEDHLEEGPFEARRAAEVCAQLAAGLGALHQVGVLHRDLKPDNVMLRTDGSAVVLDLGLAHEESAESLTRTGQLVGTPAYMSPEQALGQHREVDERSDVYALGATLFAALAGRAPFCGDNLVAVACAVIQSEAEWPAKVPPPLAAIGRKAMAKSPSDRYPDAAAFERDLYAYLAGETPEATRPPSLPYALTGLALLGALLLAALAFGPKPGPEAPSPRGRARKIAGASDTPPTPPADTAAQAAKAAKALRSGPVVARLKKMRAWLRRYPKHPLAGQVRRSFLALKLARGPHEVLGRMASKARFALGAEGLVTGYRFLPNEKGRPTEFLQRRGPGDPLQVLGQLPGDVGCDVIHRPGTALVVLCGGGNRPLRLVDGKGRLRSLQRPDALLSLWDLASSATYLAASGFDYKRESEFLSVYRWSDLIEASAVPAPLWTTGARGKASRTLGFLPDETLVGAGKPTDKLYRWKVRGDRLEALPSFVVPERIATFAVHPKRPWLALALKTFQVQIRDARSGKVLSRLQGSAGAEHEAAFLAVVQAHKSYPTSALFSPNGERLFTTSSGADSSELRVWNTAGEPATHKEYATLLRPGTGPRFLRSRISPDGRWLLTVSRLPPRRGERSIRKARKGQNAESSWDVLVELWDVGEEP